MAEEREPVLMAVAGEKGVGKTFTTIKEIKQYAKIQKRPVIIYDINMEVAYQEFKTIYPADIKNLKEGIRRVIPVTRPKGNQKGKLFTLEQKTKTLEYLLKACKNMLLLIEDINNYVQSTRVQNILGAITTNRHRGQDIILHVQSLAKLDPTLYENTGLFRLHHQKDNIARYESKIPNIEAFSIAKNIVDNKFNDGDVRFYLYLTDKAQIIGDFNKQDFERAVKRYFKLNKYIKSNIQAEYSLNNEEDIFNKYLETCKRYAKNLYI